jgi:hypothetical protein
MNSINFINLCLRSALTCLISTMYLYAVEFGISFPPIENSTHQKYTSQFLDELGVKSIRSSVQWKLIERKKSIYSWQAWDQRIEWAAKNNYRLFLTIESDAPEWAAGALRNKQSAIYKNKSDFERFVSMFAKRYTGKIEYIQFGNEWQIKYWYVGTEDDFVQAANIVYNVFKQYSPKTIVVLGGISNAFMQTYSLYENKIKAYKNGTKIVTIDTLKQWDKSIVNASLKRFNTVMEQTHYDYIDIHLYDDWNNWSAYVSAIQANKPDIPLIISEFGGPDIECPYSDSLHATELKQYLATIEKLPVKAAYYFSLTELESAHHKKSGLIRIDNKAEKLSDRLIVKPGYYVFKNFMNDLLHK